MPKDDELCLSHMLETARKATNKTRGISRDEVENLYVGGRLGEADVNQYQGLWSPL